MHAAAKPDAVVVCAACHGETGISTMDNIPSLAGQPDQFLQWQLVFFRAGSRKNEQMQELGPVIEKFQTDLLATSAGLSTFVVAAEAVLEKPLFTDDEYRAFCAYSGLAPEELHRVRAEASPLPDVRLEDYSGVILGGNVLMTTNSMIGGYTAERVALRRAIALGIEALRGPYRRELARRLERAKLKAKDRK